MRFASVTVDDVLANRKRLTFGNRADELVKLAPRGGATVWTLDRLAFFYLVRKA